MRGVFCSSTFCCELGFRSEGVLGEGDSKTTASRAHARLSHLGEREPLFTQNLFRRTSPVLSYSRWEFYVTAIRGTVLRYSETDIRVTFETDIRVTFGVLCDSIPELTFLVFLGGARRPLLLPGLFHRLDACVGGGVFAPGRREQDGMPQEDVARGGMFE